MLYVLNTAMVPIDWDEVEEVTVRIRKISVDEARLLVEEPFTSAVGHESTANILSNLLRTNVPANRISVKMKRGDSAIHFLLKERLPEGKILSEEEIEKIGYILLLSEVVED